MSYIKEKVAYLRGLSDGLNITDEAQAKLFAAIIDTMDAIADAADENESAISELGECVDDIYEDLDDIEDALFDDEDDFVEVECPHCGETVYFDQDMLESSEDLICPNCNESLMPTPMDEE